MADFTSLVQQDESPIFIHDDQLRTFVAIDVARNQLRADPHVGRDEVRHEVHRLVGVPDDAEVVGDGVGVGFDVALRTVRPESFARDDVFHAVALHVHQIDGVKLREFEAVAVFPRFLVHNGVTAELDGRIKDLVPFPVSGRDRFLRIL